MQSPSSQQSQVTPLTPSVSQPLGSQVSSIPLASDTIVDAQNNASTSAASANNDRTAKSTKKGVKDFTFGRTLGEGSYSTVFAATDRQTLTEYAIKMLDKRHIIKEKKIKYVNIERDTLNRLGDHPGIVRLYYTFQDERSLYFVLDLAAGGELLSYVKKLGSFDEECTQYYSAQILDAIEYMHSRQVIHRDIKPENVLLDDQMRVKITDFGTAKLLDLPDPVVKLDAETNVPPQDKQDNPEPLSRSRANSFVGTAEYVSPELLRAKTAYKSSDLWAFGCIIFQLLSGRPPFKAVNEYQTFQKIVNLDYSFPPNFPPVARDLIERLLVLEPSKRITVEHIKGHKFFSGIAWGKRLWKQKAPKLKPFIPGNDSTSSSVNTELIASQEGSGPSQTGIVPTSRINAKIVTELPPPSQLDLQWSPVLQKNNERILKLGNLFVSSVPTPSPSLSDNALPASTEAAPRKLSRFFHSNLMKKRQRLVMVTSGARLIIVGVGAVSGDISKVKSEIDLHGLGVVIRHVQTSPNNQHNDSFTIDTREKIYNFEDSKATAHDWVDTITKAQNLASARYTSEVTKDEIETKDSLPTASTLGIISSNDNEGCSDKHSTPSRPIRAIDNHDGRSSKRFSKRHSKNGLAAVF